MNFYSCVTEQITPLKDLNVHLNKLLRKNSLSAVLSMEKKGRTVLNLQTDKKQNTY